MVWEGLWNNTTSVAVKTLKPGITSANDFLQEAKLMIKLRHPKLVQVCAVCTKEEPVYIVMELMKHGNLRRYLQQDKSHSLKIPQLINMASQVACGMAYLEEQNVIHMDLAARSIFVGDHMICKVSNFYMSTILEDDIYEPPEGFKYLIKWTAPEAALYNRFSIKSDVWSFGILLWEIIKYGQFPYPGMTNGDVLMKVERGYRMSRPTNCPEQLYDIMMDCWQENPASRPTFETLQWQLEDFVTDDTGHPKVGDA